MSFIRLHECIAARLYLLSCPPEIRSSVHKWKKAVWRLSQSEHISDTEIALFEDCIEDIARTFLPLEQRAFLIAYTPVGLRDQLAILLIAKTQGISKQSPFPALVAFYSKTTRSALDELWRYAQSRQYAKNAALVFRPLSAPSSFHTHFTAFIKNVMMRATQVRA